MTAFLMVADPAERGILRPSFVKDRRSEPNREEVFKFLEYLRDTGVTNMLGAKPYIEHYLDVSPQAASDHLRAWLNHFDEATRLRHFILGENQ